MRGKTKCLVAASLILLFAVSFTLRYVALNGKYPNPKVNEVYIGETLMLGSYNVRLTKTERHDGFYLKELMPNYVVALNSDFGEYPPENIYVLLMQVEITKNKADTNYLDLMTIAFESGSWANQYDPDVFEKLNPNRSLYLSLQEGEKAIITFPLIALKDGFSKKEWERIEDRVFKMVFGYYPNKNLLVGATRR